MSNGTEIGMRKRISTEELERRWKAVRQAMKENGLDFLIMQNYTGRSEGYHRWFTDLGPGHLSAVIFPRDEEMTVIGHGPQSTAPPARMPWEVRGVKKRISLPVHPSAGYSCTYDAEKVVEELEPYKNCRIGLVGKGLINVSFYTYLTEHLNTAKFEDASDLVDTIKAVKSDEEINLIKGACALQDEAFKYALTCVRPGRRDFEVHADVFHKILELGAMDVNLGVTSTPAVASTTTAPVIPGNRVIEDGDQVRFLIETNGPGNYWGELGRTICLGKISPELEKVFEVAQEQQKAMLDLLKPGADSLAIWDANNEFLRSRGYPEERRLCGHGLGYDMMERPFLMSGETMRIQAGMNIVIHTGVVTPQAVGTVFEDYIVSEKGAPVCIHKTPQQIFTV